MKKLSLYAALFIAITQLSCETKTANQSQSVNPIIGDISFVQKFGYEPDATTNENLRIQTHFAYVEKLLRQKDLSHLTPELQQQRTHLLQLLHQYSAAGIFPRNYDYKDCRKPCFIDKDNRICAVGYLIEQTAGRPIAEQINGKHQYDELLAMNDQTVNNWIEKSGLTKEECAMIQPAYGPPPTYSYNHISPAYGISSSVLSGMNLSANTINVIQIAKGSNNKAIGIIGLITGTGQTVLGITNFPKTTDNFYGNTTNESQKTLSMINIGLGTSTMIVSAWNLITDKKPRDKKVTWNINSFQTPNNNTGVAFSIRSKL